MRWQTAVSVLWLASTGFDKQYATAQGGCLKWTIVDASAPAPRANTAMAYDAARGRLVLFGGYATSSPPQFFGDTWEWDGDSWTQIATDAAPAARMGHSMVYDTKRERLVLFGGNGPVDLSGFSDTWEWDGAQWQEILIAGPSSRVGFAMTYDSARGLVILFGGDEGWSGGPSGVPHLGDMWTYDGTSWQVITLRPEAPAGRAYAGIGYDSARQTVVLFGGEAAPYGEHLNDAWEWSGENWLLRTPTSDAPAPRTGALMAYNPVRQRITLFGGHDFPSQQWFNDAWQWDGQDWTQLPSGATPRSYGAIAYDGTSGQLMVFGGYSSGISLGDTWHLGRPKTDHNVDGITNVPDLLNVINGWGVCPQP